MRRALPFIILLAAIWGGSYALIKIALGEGLDPLQISAGRLVLGSAVLVPLAWKMNALAGVRRQLRPIAPIGLVQIAIPVTAIAVGQQWIPSSTAGVLNSSVPIFIAILSPFILHLHAQRLQLVGIAIGIVGVGLVYGIDLGTGFYATLGALALTLSSVGYALGPLLAARFISGISPLGMATSLIAVSAVVMAPILVIDPPPITPKAFLVVLLLGIVGTGFGFALYYHALQFVDAQRTSIIAYLIPGFAVLYGLPLGERPGPGILVGLVLILGGSTLIARRA